MRLQSSPASFSCLMDYVMREIEGALTYVADELETVLWQLRIYRLKLNVEKTITEAVEEQHLGYTLNKVGVSPSRNKLQAIRESKMPMNVKEVREVVRLANYF